jgi:uncharacterized protein YfeS
MEISVYFSTYGAHGGQVTLSLVGGFLSQEAPDFGDGLRSIELTMHFRSLGPPRKTLESLFEQFHASLERLPRITFKRQKCQAEIAFHSELATDRELETRQPSLSLFCGACREVVANIRALRRRLRKEDHFDFPAFENWLDKRLAQLPATFEELTRIQGTIEAARKAKLASLTEWEKLGVDFSDFHSDARSVLDDPRLWNVCDEFSPNGNDTGADVLGIYRDWRKRHRMADTHMFFDQLMSDWEVSIPPAPTNEYSVHTFNQAIVGLAFAQLKLEATCEPDITSMAAQALRSQPEHELTEKMLNILTRFATKTV